MKNIREYIHEYESLEISYNFSIPATNSILSEIEYKLLAEKINSFHRDYITIANKYRICKLLSNDYLEHKNLDMKDIIHVFLPSNSLKELFFFPLNLDVIGPEDSRNIFYTEIDSIESDICIDNRNVVKMVLGDSLESGKIFSIPIGFFIEVRSNIFFPFLEDDFCNKIINNKANAYLNTPRFNSFLKSLKELFYERGWDFEFEYDHKPLEILEFFTENGILIDGQIIYQEDIDNGKVRVSDFQ